MAQPGPGPHEQAGVTKLLVTVDSVRATAGAALAPEARRTDAAAAEKRLYIEVAVVAEDNTLLQRLTTAAISYHTDGTQLRSRNSSAPAAVSVERSECRWRETLVFEFGPGEQQWMETLDGIGAGEAAAATAERTTVRVRLMETDHACGAISALPFGGASGGRGLSRHESEGGPFLMQGGLTCPDIDISPNMAAVLGRGKRILHFVLRPNTLEYYVSEEEAAKSASLSTQGRARAQLSGFALPKATSVSISSKFTNCFEIEFAERSATQLFIAESHDDAMAWVECISAQLPLRRGAVRLADAPGSSNTAKRFLVWQHDTLCVCPAPPRAQRLQPCVP